MSTFKVVCIVLATLVVVGLVIWGGEAVLYGIAAGFQN